MDDHHHGGSAPSSNASGSRDAAARDLRAAGVETLAELRAAASEAALRGGDAREPPERVVAAAEALRAGREVPSCPRWTPRRPPRSDRRRPRPAQSRRAAANGGAPPQRPGANPPIRRGRQREPPPRLPRDRPARPLQTRRQRAGRGTREGLCGPAMARPGGPRRALRWHRRGGREQREPPPGASVPVVAPLLIVFGEAGAGESAFVEGSSTPRSARARARPGPSSTAGCWRGT